MTKESSPIQLASNKELNTTHPSLRLVGADQKALWDAFMAQAPHGHLLQCWPWGALKEAFGWRALRIALWDAQGQRILAAAQILLRSLPFIGMSIAYAPKGPILDWANTALCQQFFAALHPLLRSRRVAVLRIDPDLPESITSPAADADEEGNDPSPAPGNGDARASLGALYNVAEGLAVIEQLRALGFRRVEDSIQPRRTIAIDLTPDEKAIALRQKPKWRYNAGLAARKGVSVREATTLEDLQRWYDLMGVTSERDRFAVHTLDYYQKAWEVMRPANQARLLLAEHQGKLLAGIYVTLVGREGIYLYGASGNEGRNLMPNHLLQWEAMKWCKAQGATLYDLWGVADSADPNDPMAGVSRFKRGWGGQTVRYIGSFDYVYSPLGYRAMTAGMGLRKKLDEVRMRRQNHAGEQEQPKEKK
jgi:peptidoglycan pentaglycine glycine transferase (the first glycine)